MIRIATGILAIVAVSGAQAAEDKSIRITKSDCIRLVEHHPSVDVAYRPGVDVRGGKVVPADVDASPNLRNIVPQVLEFSIALNPLKGGAARFGETSLAVGTVGFDMKSRRATFNGKPLTRSETRRISKKCKAGLDGAK